MPRMPLAKSVIVSTPWALRPGAVRQGQGVVVAKASGVACRPIGLDEHEILTRAGRWVRPVRSGRWLCCRQSRAVLGCRQRCCWWRWTRTGTAKTRSAVRLMSTPQDLSRTTKSFAPVPSIRVSFALPPVGVSSLARLLVAVGAHRARKNQISGAADVNAAGPEQDDKVIRPGAVRQGVMRAAAGRGVFAAKAAGGGVCG